MNSNWKYNPEMLKSGQNRRFFCSVRPWNLTDDLEQLKGTSSRLCQALRLISQPLVNSNLGYSKGTPKSGQNQWFFCPVWTWKLMDDFEKQKGTSFMLLQALCIFSKPSANSNSVTVWKHQNRGKFVLTSVTLTFDLLYGHHFSQW